MKFFIPNGAVVSVSLLAEDAVTVLELLGSAALAATEDIESGKLDSDRHKAVYAARESILRAGNSVNLALVYEAHARSVSNDDGGAA